MKVQCRYLSDGGCLHPLAIRPNGGLPVCFLEHHHPDPRVASVCKVQMIPAVNNQGPEAPYQGTPSMFKNFRDLFTEQIDFPHGVAANILPLGIQWNYVSSQFLNGFINYVHIERAWLLERYTVPDEPWTDHDMSVMDPPKSFQYKPLELILDANGQERVRREALKVLLEPGRLAPPDLRALGDDVLILGKVRGTEKTQSPVYMFFHFDCDVSDCSIGRFVLPDNWKQQELINAFDRYAAEFSGNVGEPEEWTKPPRLIPQEFFDGWISF